METVWKFTLEFADMQKIDMPEGATILHVASQSSKICFWANVLDDAPKERRTFYIAGTGHPKPPGKYIGTAQTGPYVWHVYEGEKPEQA